MMIARFIVPDFPMAHNARKPGLTTLSQGATIPREISVEPLAAWTERSVPVFAQSTFSAYSPDSPRTLLQNPIRFRIVDIAKHARIDRVEVMRSIRVPPHHLFCLSLRGQREKLFDQFASRANRMPPIPFVPWNHQQRFCRRMESIDNPLDRRKLRRRAVHRHE